MKDEWKKARVNTEKEPPETLSQFELSYITAGLAFEYLCTNYGKESYNAKIRYWFNIFEADFRGELFLRDLIATAKKEKPNNYSDKKRDLVIKHCLRRIRKERYWVFKAENIWKMTSAIIGYILGFGSGYWLWYLTHK